MNWIYFFYRRDRNQEDEIRELGGKDDFDLSRTGIEDIERG